MNQLSEQELPYEKFLQKGPDSLSDAELLAVIIRSGSKDASALSISRQILNIWDKGTGLNGLHHITLARLQQIKGVGMVTAIKMKCIAELSKRIAMSDTKHEIQFNKPQTVAKYYMEQMRHLEKEHCYSVFLDTKSNLIKESCLSIGSINASIVSTRELFREGVLVDAAFILLLHNHPSGDPTPSREDMLLTEKVIKASKLMDIPLIDHIIIGDNKYTSFKENNLL